MFKILHTLYFQVKKMQEYITETKTLSATAQQRAYVSSINEAIALLKV